MEQGMSHKSFWLLLFLTLLVRQADAIWCENEDCYEVLGVSDKATPQEIRKAYLKLSLKHHPDKNPDKDAQSTFAKIANAYEILYDAEKREQYDYALAHPEQFFYNTARYYQTIYQPKADLRIVLVVLLLLFSAFQYMNDWLRYHQALEHAKQTPAYKNRVKALEAQRQGSNPMKRKGSKNKFRSDSADDLSQELDLQIHGAEKPELWRLVGVRFVLLPFTLGKMLLWELLWIKRYRFQGKPYTWADAEYLTRVALGLAGDRWRNIGMDQRDKLCMKRLWVKSNLTQFQAETKKESRGRGRR